MLTSDRLGFTEHRFVMETPPMTAPRRGVRTNAAVNTIVARLLFMSVLPLLTMCAPQAQSISSDGTSSPELANPFGSGEDDRRLLQSYIKSKLKEGQTGPELNTREQEVFFLFSLFDYDRSGQMDGLELLQLLTDFLSYHAITPKSTDSVVSLVDDLLQTQDLNQDGLLAPSELLASPTLDPQQENIVPPDVRAEPIETDAKTKNEDPEVDEQDNLDKLLEEQENEAQPVPQADEPQMRNVLLDDKPQPQEEHVPGE